jgi:hypothetical protein
LAAGDVTTTVVVAGGLAAGTTVVRLVHPASSVTAPSVATAAPMAPFRMLKVLALSISSSREASFLHQGGATSLPGSRYYISRPGPAGPAAPRYFFIAPCLAMM